MQTEIEKLKFPIGQFQKPEPITPKQLTDWIKTIENFPAAVLKLLEKASPEDFKKTYRPEGWSVLQLVHHCADSHMNAFIRFKLALTEDAPVIKPYFEDRWATLPDTLLVDPYISIKLLESLHARWVVLIQSLTAEDLKRTYIHPEHGKQFSLAETIGMYDWHCRHHLEHLKIALKS